MRKQNLKIMSLLVSIIGLLCLLIGSSYAVLQNDTPSINNEVINVGKVKLKLIDKDGGITINDSFFYTDEEAFKASEFYSFTISNIGDTPAEYDLLLVSDASTENTLDEKYIKVGLEVNGEAKVFNLKEVNNILHSTVISINEDIEYKLRLWIDSDKVDDESIFSDKILNLKLKVNATQYMGESNTKNTFYNIMKNEVKETNISYKYINNANITENGITYNNNDNGVFLYNGTDDNNGSLPIYYYRGNVTNNNVIFGNFCWKIVRTTSTGGTKLIYNGVPTNGTCNNTGEDSTIGESAFNTNFSSPADVGYMYGTRYAYTEKDMSTVTDTYVYGNDVTYSDGTYTLVTTKTSSSWSSDKETLSNGYHYTCLNSIGTCTKVYYITYFGDSTYMYYLTFTGGITLETAKDKMFTNTNDSTIKTYIDNWYKDNLIDYSSFLENTIFCNDRVLSEGELSGALTSKDSSSLHSSYFLTAERVNTTYIPSLTCSRILDKFSLSIKNGGVSGFGNNKLTYPIGLLTVDEALLAGTQGVESNDIYTSDNYYLYTGSTYYLLSPSFYMSKGSTNWYIYRDNGVSGWYSYILRGVRPVISLKQDTLILDGTGFSNDPYLA